MKRRSAVAAAVIALAGTANAQVPGAETQGVWRSHGYGYIVRIDAAGTRLFHAVDGVCYADPRPDPDPDGLLAAPRSVSPDVIAFASGSASTPYLFDRLPAAGRNVITRRNWVSCRLHASSERASGRGQPPRASAIEGRAPRRTRVVAGDL